MTPAFPKMTLKLALSQNLVPSRFREELNVMANNQDTEDDFKALRRIAESPT